MKEIYLAVMERLKTKLPALRWVDIDEGQLEVRDRATVAFPCALVRVELRGCSNLYGAVQLCPCRVTVRVAQNILASRTNSEAEADVRETALERYELASEVYAALHHFGTETFNPLARTAMSWERRSDGLLVAQLDFATEFQDNTAAEA